MDYLFSFIEKKYGICTYFLEQIKEDAQSYQYLKKRFTLNKDYSRTCVKLDIDNLTEEEYWNSLSKSVRQNIRTAINRCKKDNIQLKVKVDDSDVVLQNCVDMREKRVRIKHDKEGRSRSFLAKVKCKIISWLRFKFPLYLAMSEDANAHFLSVYANDWLCAFFQYGKDERRCEIVVMSAGVEDEYTRYSPGLLGIYNYVLEQIREGYKIHTIDFTRGDEKYKYDVGGKSHFIHSIKFVWHEGKNS